MDAPLHAQPSWGNEMVDDNGAQCRGSTDYLNLFYLIIEQEWKGFQSSEAQTDAGLKLNYCKKVFFPHPFICTRNFITKKSWKSKKLRPPSIQLLKRI